MIICEIDKEGLAAVFKAINDTGRPLIVILLLSK